MVNHVVMKLRDGELGLLVERDMRGMIVRSRIIKLSKWLRSNPNSPIVDYVEMDPFDVVARIRMPNNGLGLVMLAMLAIPRGSVASYSDIAELVGMTPRLVGLFASRNPIPVIVPCHRVVNKDGLIGGYSVGDGDGMLIKARLLRMEDVEVDGLRVNRNYFVSFSELKRRFYMLYNYYHSIVEGEFSSFEELEF